MSRQANHIETEEIKIRTTPVVARYLERLVATGLYGKTRAEAAERLVSGALERLIMDGTLLRPLDN